MVGIFISSKGILFIEHIFDYQSNVLYTCAQLQWLYDLSEYLNYITLIM